MAPARSLIAMMLAVAKMASMVAANYDMIAGYTPVSDVVEHSEIDLDMEDLEAGADLQTDEGFQAAWKAYSEGGNRWGI